MEKRAGTKSAARKAAIVHIVITVIVMAVIFVHSAMPGDASTAESDVIVLRILKFSGMDHDFVSFLVRKAAHCAVYMALGGCLMLNVIDLVKWKAIRAAGLDRQPPAIDFMLCHIVTSFAGSFLSQPFVGVWTETNCSFPGMTSARKC